ncbi:uncharacterized protein METZ01_LOCUS209480, partial [marine metagenome]
SSGMRASRGMMRTGRRSSGRAGGSSRSSEIPWRVGRPWLPTRWRSPRER